MDLQHTLALIAGLLLIVLYGLTRLGTAYVARRYPPLGTLVETSGGAVHVLIRPAGRPDAPVVVLVHGASGNLRDPLMALDDTLKGEFTRVYVDRPGLGWSQRQGARDASPRQQAARIIEALRLSGIDRFLLLGHSFGGSVVAQMALIAPSRVRGLLFVSPATHPWPGGINWYYQVAAMPFMGQIFARFLALPFGWFSIEAASASVFAPQTPPARYGETIGARLVLRPDSFIANGEDVAWLKGFVIEAAGDYARITAPCLIITGDEDGIVYPEIHSDGLEEAISGAEKIVLEGVGHAPHHTHPEIIRDGLRRLLARGA